MKIAIKLSCLVVLSLALSSLAVGTYSLILSPIGRMEREHDFFKAAASTCLKLQIQASNVMTEDFAQQGPKLEAATADYRKALQDISKITYLPSLNKTIKESVETVANLSSLSESSLESVKAGLDGLRETSKSLLENPDLASVSALYNLDVAGNAAKADSANLARFSMTALAANLKDLNQSLDATYTIITEKDQVIAQEIARIRARSLNVALAVAGAILLLSILISFFFSRSIVRSIRSMMGTIKVMASGDLRGRFDTAKKDEIGELGRDLENLLEMFNQALLDILRASRQNAQVREDLVSAVSEATSSAIEIRANSESIGKQMENLDGRINRSGESMHVIVEAIEKFTARLEAQNRHIGDSVSAVTQTLASIDNINRIVNQDKASAEELVRITDRGKEVFDEAFDRVADIGSSVGVIQEMAAVISQIADQTNILAMNAAIEAAHAGEFGKGFAVVADEIAHLASVSSESSKEINQSIGKVVISINEAADTKQGTSDAFNEINQKIRLVSDSIGEIYSNVNEMQLGNRQVLEAMENLRGGSGEIMGQATEIERGSQGIREIFSDVGRISHEVASNIAEISQGLADITESIQDISKRSEKIAEAGSTLDTAVSRFMVSETSPAAASE